PFITIQPSEFTKIAIIVFLAMLVVKHKEKFKVATAKSDLWLIAKILLFTALPVAFIAVQTDLGTAIVFLFIAGLIILFSCIDWIIFCFILFSIISDDVLSLFLFVNFPEIATEKLGIQPYQIKRVVTWFDPTVQVSDDTFQIDRSLLSVGSGQLTGKGMKSAEVGLPEAHT